MPLGQPHSTNNLHPLTNDAGNLSQELQFAGAVVPHILDCSLLIAVPGLPQILLVEYCKSSKPGIIRSICILPASHPFDQGGHLFLRITKAVQSEFFAAGFLINIDLPQPKFGPELESG